MLYTSAGKIVVPASSFGTTKINEMKNEIENFWLIYALKSVSFHFFLFSEVEKLCKKLGCKKIGDFHCIGRFMNRFQYFLGMVL